MDVCAVMWLVGWTRCKGGRSHDPETSRNCKKTPRPPDWHVIRHQIKQQTETWATIEINGLSRRLMRGKIYSWVSIIHTSDASVMLWKVQVKYRSHAVLLCVIHRCPRVTCTVRLLPFFYSYRLHIWHGWNISTALVISLCNSCGWTVQTEWQALSASRSSYLWFYSWIK